MANPLVVAYDAVWHLLIGHAHFSSSVRESLRLNRWTVLPVQAVDARLQADSPAAWLDTVGVNAQPFGASRTALVDVTLKLYIFTNTELGREMLDALWAALAALSHWPEYLPKWHYDDRELVHRITVGQVAFGRELKVVPGGWHGWSAEVPIVVSCNMPTETMQKE